MYFNLSGGAKIPSSKLQTTTQTCIAPMSQVFSTQVLIEHYIAPYLGISTSTFSIAFPYELSLLNREFSKKFTAVNNNYLCSFLLSIAKTINKVIYLKGGKGIDLFQTVENMQKINLWRFIISSTGKIARKTIIEQTVSNQPFPSEVQIYDSQLKRSMPLILQIIRFGKIDLIRLCLEKNKNYKIGKIEISLAEKRMDFKVEKAAILQLLHSHNSIAS